MSVSPDTETLTALSRLTRSAEWTPIEKWLVARREAAVLRSFSSDDAKSRQAQGSAMEIDDFLKITRGAELSVAR